MTKLTDAPAQRVLDDAVAEFARATRLPLAFGGFVSDGVATVTALAGHRTMSLDGLRVESGRGLGGRAMHELRPRLTTDYMRSRQITHDYDTEINAEDIMLLVAMPVVVERRVRAVLYAGTRGGSVHDASFVNAAAGVAGDLAQEIRVQDEVERRLAAASLERPVHAAAPAPLLESLRSSQAELRRIVAEVEDPALRERLASLERRLASAGCGSEPQRPAPREGVASSLSRRELDVVAHAALGLSNAQIGSALGLTESTVKSYMQAAMSKLGVSSRHAAVSTARLHGLIL
ncbi:helix-turn-helix transcriptional regulator [Leucobacter massiliensis]|uniref:HTH luxR-type domain-containing protein n=1 Tax=Leucobacter massiliensis TaxID=1686285 RepID=A0A2S9QM20_9MICO|nr:LuxR C-terminal-related transcriptional regulator [Leucobacter massiliensis]PRI10636.1 hypothetical protein B4915_06920 [Leucobacter massiliensis]